MVRYAEIACNSNCYPHVVSTTVHYVSRATAIRKRALWIVLARHAVYTDCACVRCGASLIGVTETAGAECDDYIHNPPPLAEGRAVFRYQGLARKMILELKHGYRQKLAAPAAAGMSQIASDILTEKSLIVPIPVHWQRFLQRKYNQAEVLAKHVVKHSGAELKPDILRRPRKTVPVKQFKRSERFAILENAFEINP
jgi:predicted amidophosphoribosyltransferase